jgi:hypothetical protein
MKPNNFEEQLKKQLEASEWMPSDTLWDKIEQNIQSNSFEPKLQYKLNDFSVKPSDNFWDKIEPQLSKSRKKRSILWFSFIAFISVSTFTIAYWLHTKNEIKIKPPQTLIAAKSKPSLAIAPSNEINKNLNTPKKLVVKESANNLFEPKNAPNKGQAVYPLVQTEIFIDRSEKTRGIKSNESQLASTLNDMAQSTEVAQVSIFSQQAKEQFHTKSDTILSSDSSQKVKVSNFEAKEIFSANNLTKDTFVAITPVGGSLYSEPEGDFTAFSITIKTGVHYSIITNSLPPNSRYNLEKSYRLRNTMENAALDFSGALMVDYHLNKSWMVSLGIGITSFTQNLNFHVTSANQTNPDRAQPANLYMHASDSIISGSGNLLENKYSFTEIPIQLTYLFKGDGKFQFGLGAGFSYGRLNLVNAYHIDPSCIGLLIVNDKNAFPQFRDVFFASFSPSLAMRINSSAAIGLMPQFKMALHSMVDNPDWIQQRPNLIGLNLFLKKQF